MHFNHSWAVSSHFDIEMPWHVLYTRHQHEKSVAQALTGKGHEVFLPLIGMARRWQDRNKLVWLPLFPCYVFITGGLDRYVQILSTPGVVSVVTSAGRPAIVPNAQIETVRQLVEGSVQVEPHPYLQRGDRVRVVAGPLRGIEGILLRKKNAVRLIVSVELLAQSAAVEIDSACIEPCSAVTGAMAMQSRRYSATA